MVRAPSRLRGPHFAETFKFGCKHSRSFFEKKFYMRFHWWPTVLLERECNLANNCSGIEKRHFLNVIFSTLHFFPNSFFADVSEKNYIDTNNNSAQLVQLIVVKRDKILFPINSFVFRNFSLIAQVSCLHLRTKSLLYNE